MASYAAMRQKVAAARQNLLASKQAARKADVAARIKAQQAKNQAKQAQQPQPVSPGYDQYGNPLQQGAQQGYDQFGQPLQMPGYPQGFDPYGYPPGYNPAQEQWQGQSPYLYDQGGGYYDDGGYKIQGVEQAIFSDLDAAARALVATAYRAAPRDWGHVGAAEMASLATYPIQRVKLAGGEGWSYYQTGCDDRAPPVLVERSVSEANKHDKDVDLRAKNKGLGVAIWRQRADGWRVGVLNECGGFSFEGADIDEPINLGWWPGFGPSAEAEATFRGLTADWEAFDRLGVGERILRHLEKDKYEWRSFRAAWKSANIDSTDIGGRLNAEVHRANRVRRELADAKVVDPALLGDRQGADVTDSTNALKASVPIDNWASKIPILNWATSPASSLKDLDPRGPVGDAKKKLMWVVGGAAALFLLLFATRGGSTNVYLPAASRAA